MKITYETNRDNTLCTFYSLEVGKIFKIEKSESNDVYLKYDYDKAFNLTDNTTHTFVNGMYVHKLDAELIIHERVEGTGIY